MVKMRGRIVACEFARPFRGALFPGSRATGRAGSPPEFPIRLVNREVSECRLPGGRIRPGRLYAPDARFIEPVRYSAISTVSKPSGASSVSRLPRSASARSRSSARNSSRAVSGPILRTRKPVYPRAATAFSPASTVASASRSSGVPAGILLARQAAAGRFQTGSFHSRADHGSPASAVPGADVPRRAHRPPSRRAGNPPGRRNSLRLQVPQNRGCAPVRRAR